MHNIGIWMAFIQLHDVSDIFRRFSTFLAVHCLLTVRNSRHQTFNGVLYVVTLAPNTFIHRFHWHVQNVSIPCFLGSIFHSSLLYIISFHVLSTNYSSILPCFILPSISWSTSESCYFTNLYIIHFWEFLVITNKCWHRLQWENIRRKSVKNITA